MIEILLSNNIFSKILQSTYSWKEKGQNQAIFTITAEEVITVVFDERNERKRRRKGRKLHATTMKLTITIKEWKFRFTTLWHLNENPTSHEI